MTDQTKFEAVQTQTIDARHSSSDSTNESGFEITVEPRALSSWQVSKVIGVVIDVLAITISCMFFAYAIAVKTHENAPMDSARVQLLVKLSQLGPTIYPILFAAVVGKAFKSIAFWKLERGSSLGTLDRLLGSMTIVQTVLTQDQMRSWNLVGLLLILIWSLSPLGSQASLRIINSADQPNNTTRPIQYVNTTSDILSDHYAGADTASQFVPPNVLFGAAIVGNPSVSSSSVDTWNNLRIPWIERMDPTTASAEGWYTIPQLNSSDDYTSLIGVPLSVVSHADNLTTSFNIETSYLALTCPVLLDLDDGSTGTVTVNEFETVYMEVQKFNPEPRNGTASSSNLALASGPGYYFDFLGPLNTKSSRYITYVENNNERAHWVVANCTIKTTYVEVSVFCSVSNCTAVNIRKSHRWHNPESWTSFDSSGNTFNVFARNFVWALAPGHVTYPSPYQKFIIDPLNPFNTSFAIPPVSVVLNATFALRLGQLFNTYWMSLLAPTAIPKGLRNSNLTADIVAISGTSLSTATATETRFTSVLRCNLVWFVILLLSSAITAFIGLCGLMTAFWRLGPDIGFNISSLVKDSPFVDQKAVATTLDSTERSILMKDWYAKLGVVAAEDEIGYIAIGSGNVADLQRERLYR